MIERQTRVILGILSVILLIASLGIGINAYTSYQKSHTPNPTKEAVDDEEVLGEEVTPDIAKASATASATMSAPTLTFTVSRVVDGDTIVLNSGETVRLIGIDTPETVDPRRPVGCYGKEASNFTKSLLTGNQVRLEKDISETDKYGRLLRLIYVQTQSGEIFVNDYLVRQGFAQAKTWPPDVKYQQQFLSAEHEAKANNRGLWQACQS